MDMADSCNARIDACAPWKMIKDDAQREQVKQLTSAMLESYWLMIGYLAPVLPELFTNSCRLFGRTPEMCEGLAVAPLAGSTISPFTHLFKRLEQPQVDAMIS